MDPNATAAPLILTLGFDAASFARLDALRRAHFPPARNFIPAHLTLFHALPGDALQEIAARLAQVAAATPPLKLSIGPPRSLGRGVALAVEGGGLCRLRRELADGWAGMLSRQDQNGFRPHVTIQNKVAPDAARALLAELAADFLPWPAEGETLLLWHYRGGPWQAAAAFPLRG
ncbi:2'-5' RNA ligase family protein [Pseudoroseomonas globiformis]|uniref:2'-5' RNA ligase family protein n=1 Tax=Teichococcus globiformis TaxID=2307229 RepID=A0ABV7FX75_9PROT